ncbi:type II secretion system protein GspN [Desulfosudis oleivorans]|uniref:Type II secretion system protein GspN n=1 Tax=Desulfosudis oleivorans (strain DSM 6200 / JCM 39069 / Hxd3) TaxID=96561 RepID=A8ZWZ3_DESOH|nr:type II secretion system protein GspN [Desulfosudis oleivorans]ABW66849.1 hypothetical protein Dole_1039 [Desulfosudis oleivorans Hxd3]
MSLKPPMTGKRKILIAYAAYSLAMIALFMVLLFPDQAVRDFLEQRAGGIYPDMRIRIGALRPALPFSVRMADVSVFWQDRPYGDFEYVKVTPSVFSMWRHRRPLSFKGRTFDGRFKGVCGQDRKTDAWTLDVAFSGMALGAMEGVQRLLPHEIKGTAAGHIKAVLDNGGRPLAEYDVVLSDVVVALSAPVFSIDTVAFDRIEAAVVMEGNRVRIENCTGSGEQLDGELSGEIQVRQPYGQSLLRVKGFVRPQASLVAKLGESLPVEMVLGQNAGEKGLPISFTGTLADPKVSFK